MSWQEYVKRHVAGRSQVSVAALTGVSQAAVSRWLKGTQGVDAAKAIEFARAVDDEPLNALVAAGFLTPAEAKARPAPAPDFSQLSNQELLDLIGSRMREEGDGDVSTAMSRAAGSAALSTAAGEPTDLSAAAGQGDLTVAAGELERQSAYGTAARRGRRQRTDEPGDGA